MWDVELQWEVCPDGVRRVERQGGTTLMTGQGKASATFEYVSDMRMPFERTMRQGDRAPLQGAISEQLANAHDEPRLLAFMDEYGIPGGQHGGNTVDAVENVRGQISLLLMTLNSEGAKQIVQKINQAFSKSPGLAQLVPEMTAHGTQPRIMLKQSSIVGFMLMEIAAASVAGAEIPTLPMVFRELSGRQVYGPKVVGKVLFRPVPGRCHAGTAERKSNVALVLPHFMQHITC